MCHVACITTPILCILSCSMHHCTYSVHNVSCNMHHYSYSVHNVSCSMLHCTYSVHNVSCSMHHCTYSVYNVSCSKHHCTYSVHVSCCWSFCCFPLPVFLEVSLIFFIVYFDIFPPLGLPFLRALHGNSNPVGTANFFLFETHGILTCGTY